MGSGKKFASREAKLACSSEEFYGFITDMRNFAKILPAGVSRWTADETSCRFSISPLGETGLKIISRSPYSSVKFEGAVLVSNTFQLDVMISDGGSGKASAELFMEADLNPVIAAMAAGPIEKFLETLVTEMEKYKGWTE
ncbi:MAG TPA: hypothetical protein VMT63_06230 [Bacteroidales bacterium]|nr:hypothetical protein [Bacteroidales bacterium]